MPLAPSPPRRGRRLFVLVASQLLAAYVVLNVVFVGFVTHAWHVDLTIEVLGEQDRTPVVDAAIELRRANGTIVAGARAATRSDADGVGTVGVILQQQPLWRWPLLGSVHLVGLVVRVTAPGGVIRDVPLRLVLPPLQLASPRARLQVRMPPR